MYRVASIGPQGIDNQIIKFIIILIMNKMKKEGGDKDHIRMSIKPGLKKTKEKHDEKN